MKNIVWKTSLAGNVALLIILFALYLSGALHFGQQALYDYDMRHSMSHLPHEDIKIVTVDEESMAALGKFPWPRDVYIPFLQAVSQARVVGFDISFTTNSDDPAIDEAFAEELAKHRNVILPVTIEMETFFNNDLSYNRNELLKGHQVYQTIPILGVVSEAAHINANIDSDGVIRRTWLNLDSDEGVYPSLALKAIEMYGGDATSFLKENPQTEIKIKYDVDARDFEVIPFINVMNGDVPPENFEDSIVLIGSQAAGLDAGPTPIDKNMYKVFIHANIINQILQDRHVHTVPEWVIALAMMVMFAVTIWFAWRLKPIWSVVIVFALIGAMVYGQWYLFQAELVFFDVAYVLLTLVAAFFVNISMKTYFETRHKNFITRQFGRYISPDLVKQISKSDTELPLGGVNKELSILFLDISGFTTLSEKLQPQEVVGFLNMMFDMITNKALENHGTIDKFIGDAAMIIFNAPLDVPHHPYYAVNTAYEIQQAMVAIREDIQTKYDVSISIRIGINTGDVVVGNIGSFLRVDYTAIGDHVNTAARIESNAKVNSVFVSEATYERTKEYFTYEFAGEKMMKGKTVGINLYEVKEHVKSP